MITCKSTAELFKAIRQTLEAGNTPVIQTNVPEIVFEVLKTLKGYPRYCPVWNEKATLAQGLRHLRMSVEFPDSDIIPVFLAKHPVGQLSKPFVRIVADGLYCKLDGLASELVNAKKVGCFMSAIDPQHKKDRK